MIFRGGKFLINTIYMRNSDRPAGMPDRRKAAPASDADFSGCAGARRPCGYRRMISLWRCNDMPRAIIPPACGGKWRVAGRPHEGENRHFIHIAMMRYAHTQKTVPHARTLT